MYVLLSVVVTVLGYTEVPSSHIVGVLSDGNCISLPPEVVEPTNSSDTEEGAYGTTCIIKLFTQWCGSTN